MKFEYLHEYTIKKSTETNERTLNSDSPLSTDSSIKKKTTWNRYLKEEDSSRGKFEKNLRTRTTLLPLTLAVLEKSRRSKQLSSAQI